MPALQLVDVLLHAPAFCDQRHSGVPALHCCRGLPGSNLQLRFTLMLLLGLLLPLLLQACKQLAAQGLHALAVETIVLLATSVLRLRPRPASDVRCMRGQRDRAHAAGGSENGCQMSRAVAQREDVMYHVKK